MDRITSFCGKLKKLYILVKQNAANNNGSTLLISLETNMNGPMSFRKDHIYDAHSLNKAKEDVILSIFISMITTTQKITFTFKIYHNYKIA